MQRTKDVIDDRSLIHGLLVLGGRIANVVPWSPANMRPVAVGQKVGRSEGGRGGEMVEKRRRVFEFEHHVSRATSLVSARILPVCMFFC
jgi:hypothetical protein